MGARIRRCDDEECFTLFTSRTSTVYSYAALPPINIKLLLHAISAQERSPQPMVRCKLLHGRERAYEHRTIGDSLSYTI